MSRVASCHLDLPHAPRYAVGDERRRSLYRPSLACRVPRDWWPAVLEQSGAALSKALWLRLHGAFSQGQYRGRRSSTGFQNTAKRRRLRMTSARRAFSWAPLFVFRTQHLPSLRVHQMRLRARKARHLDVSEVIVFGVISGPSLDVVAVLGQR